MDNNLLKQLIAQHRRVVIPDFGAFLKKETPQGEELVFSPFLRKDDGTVTDAIVREYGVETEDARAMVAEFVIYLRQSLASSGRYYIEGVGMLAADANGTVTLKEGEMPEPEPVVPESIPEPEAQPVRVQPMPQQVQQTPTPGFARAGQQAQGQPVPGATRPQSIQVQPPVQQPVVPPVQQIPVQQPPYPGMAQQPQMPGYAQRQGMPVQQPFQRPQPMPQIPQPQQSVRPPVPGQPVRGGQAPMTQGQPPVRGGQLPLPPSQRQPQTAVMGGGTVPPRGPQGPNVSGRGPGMPGGQNGKPGQSQRRQGQQRRRPQKTKTDIWLIVAIIAALVVIAIMIYGFINTGKSDIDMEMINAAMAPVQDSATVVDPGL